MKKTPLEIQLLGPVKIISDGKPLKISRRAERAILYILAVEHRPVGRSKLIDMLWPQAEQMDPRGTLRTALSRLRNELPEPAILVTEIDQVWLDHDRCEIDFAKFEHYYESLQGVLVAYQEDRALPAQIVNQILKALSVWHGNSVMHGEDLSSYSEIEIWRQSVDRRANYQRKYLTRRLAEHYRAAGHPEKALDLFRQLSAMDVLDVDNQLAVMKILTSLGRNQEAIEFCEALESVYESEYSAPLPKAILSQCQLTHKEVEICENDPPKDWIIPLTMQLPLVGRQSELSQLRQAFYSGGLAVVQGELGSGKSRLVQELFQSLFPKPTLFLAPGRAMESTLPLSPIIYGLRHHVSKILWQDIDSVWAKQLSLLLPELSEIRDDCDQAAATAYPSGKQHLFDALHQVLSIMANNSGKVLFLLEDAQWVDKQTLEAVSYLIFQGFFDHQGSLIIANRPEEPNHDLDEMINRFHRTHAVQVIGLHGLSPNELGVMAKFVLNEPPSAAFIDRLYNDTNGNPFVALEIIRDVLEMPGTFEGFSSTETLPLPASVHALIQKRLNRLDNDSRHILRCAALLGNSFSLDSLLAIAEIKTSSEINIIEPLVRAGVIQSTDEANPHLMNLHFAHEKMREVVLKDTTPMVQEMLHRRIAQYMVKTPLAKEKAAVIANHFLLSRNFKNAFHWFLKAAEHAWSLGAREDVLRAYQQAESLFKNTSVNYFDTNAILELYQSWSKFAYETNQVEMLEKTGIKLQYLAERDSNYLLMGASQTALADACFLRGEYDICLNLIDEAIENFEMTHDLMNKVSALLRKAVYNWWALKFNESLVLSEKVLELCTSIKPETPEVVAAIFKAQHTICMVYNIQGKAKKALKIAQDNDKLYSHKLKPYNRLRTLYMLAQAHLISANYGDCRHSALLGLEIAKTLHNNYVEEMLLVILSKSEFIEGHLDEAYQHASRALQSAEKNNNLPIIVLANCILGDIFCFLHNFSTSIQHYRIAKLREGSANPSFFGTENDIHLARFLIWKGQLSEAKSLLQPALKISEDTGMQEQYCQAVMAIGLCDLIEGNVISAKTNISKSLEIAEQKELIHQIGWAKINLVQLAMSQHQFDKAKTLLDHILAETQFRNMAWLSLTAFTLQTQVQKAITNQPALSSDHPAFNTLLNMLDSHSQSDPLRQDFINSKKAWLEGHHYP